MSDYKLSPDKPIDVAEILKDLENYRPRRRGWTWRKPVENLHMGPFVYHDCTEPLKSSVPLPPAHYFENIDPQPAPVITTEIASGRFEDDIRRMRMAAHHGADHIMVSARPDRATLTDLSKAHLKAWAAFPLRASRFVHSARHST